VSSRSRLNHPGETAYHIPANFYFRLQKPNWTPTLYQLSALSESSEYHLVEWLRVFEFHPDTISRLQAVLPYPRTALIDTTLYDPRATIPWFREQPAKRVPPVAALSQLLESSGLRQISTLVSPIPDTHVYAKIGTADALAFPELLPGSIVRANPNLLSQFSRRANGHSPESLFLVEHRNGYCCCRLHYGGADRIALVPAKLPFANTEFQLGSEARIVGPIDLEFRFLPGSEASRRSRCALPEVAPDLARSWKPEPLERGGSAQRFTALLRTARQRAGLSFAEASQMSRVAASLLGDDRYFVSQASLSDYEARRTLPRHIHKLFTICALYSISFHELLRSFGLALQQDRSTAIPDEWMPQAQSETEPQMDQSMRQSAALRGFLADLRERLGTSPFFLRDSLAYLAGLPELSLHDVFWVGGKRSSLDPALAGSLFVIVNRRRRTPPAFLRKLGWERPLYLLLRRNGVYDLASCTLENHTLVIHPRTRSFLRSERLQNGLDVEVVGQITAVLRTLPSPS
jgi:transcriptional regulator with XRE-family HTH domain